MTTKPFEVQGDRIVINGFELQVTESGGLNVDGSPISGGAITRNAKIQETLGQRLILDLDLRVQCVFQETA